MSFRVSKKIARAIVGSVALVAVGGVALAQMRPPSGDMGFPPLNEFDPAQLPEFKGKVAQYTVTPRGGVDGIILADGTEVKISPRLSAQLTFSIKPGDQVVIHGLKARSDALIVAVTIANPANGAVIGGQEGRPQPGQKPTMLASGKIRALLHNMRGDVNGALLEDGTAVRISPREVEKMPDLVKVGAPLLVRGFGTSTALGKSVWAVEIGASEDSLTRLKPPHRDGAHGGWRGGDRPHGPRADGANPPSPAPK